MITTSEPVTGEPVVLHFAGDIDLATGHFLLTAIDAALTQGARAIVIDLSLVTFFGSTGIHTLIEGRERIAAAGATLTIAAISGPVRRALTITDSFELLGLERTD
jgi:anti-sigma B factor antagonist